MEQNANMGAHMATHISGRATVAVDAYVFRRVYIKLQMYRCLLYTSPSPRD